MRWCLGLVALVTCLAGHTDVALGDEPESRTLFAQGRELREAGKCQDAITLFRKSLEVHPDGLGALRNIAECEETIGRLASARRSWRDLKVSVQRLGEARYSGWDADAAAAMERLAPRVAKLKIRLEGAGIVRVDGEPLDPRLLGIEIEQDLGPKVIVLDDGTASPLTRNLVLEEGKSYVVDLAAKTSKGPDGPAGAQPGPNGSGPKGPGTAEQPEPSGVSPLMIGGIVSLAVGGLALGGMGAAIGVRAGALAEVEERCPSYETAPCEGALQEDVDRGTTASILVNVFAAVGGAAAATGISLIVVDLTTGGPATAPASGVKLRAGPVAGGFFLSLSSEL